MSREPKPEPELRAVTDELGTTEPGASDDPATATLARDLLAACAERGWDLAVAESLTGGLLASTVVDVPGASAVFRGGVVAYSSRVKADVLGVDSDLLASVGAVDPRVAQAMADGVCEVLQATVGLATTGVAGPALSDGKAVGCAYVAVSSPGGSQVRRLQLGGDRTKIRSECVRQVMILALDTLLGDLSG